MTFEGSCRSHQRAGSYPDATPRVHPPKAGYQVKKLLPVVSWIGFLASAVSEYGFDLDFPLTPALWLVIAVCTLVMATAHDAIRSQVRTHGDDHASHYNLATAIARSDFIGPNMSAQFLVQLRPGRAWFDGLAQDMCRDTGGVAGKQPPQMDLEDTIITTTTAVLPAILLNPADIRGPPSSESQIDVASGRPARQLSTIPRPSPDVPPSFSGRRPAALFAISIPSVRLNHNNSVASTSQCHEPGRP